MAVYSSNDNVWMTSALALKWINDVLKPHTEKFNRSLLIWDLFSTHIDEAARSRLAEINVDVLYVPAGLTYCLQPLDVYVNRSLKDSIRTEWDNFIKDPANLKTEGKIKKPTKAIAAKWTIEASLKMKISSDRFLNCILRSSRVDKDGV